MGYGKSVNMVVNALYSKTAFAGQSVTTKRPPLQTPYGGMTTYAFKKNAPFGQGNGFKAHDGSPLLDGFNPGVPWMNGISGLTTTWPLIMPTPKVQPRKLRVYGYSDAHLNRHSDSVDGQEDTVARSKIVSYLEMILLEQMYDPQELVVIPNGDIEDLVDSWPPEVSAQGTIEDEDRRREVIQKILLEIRDNNADYYDRVRRLLKLENVKFHHNIGNHERWMADEELQKFFKREILKLPPDDWDKYEFSRLTYIPEIGLLAMHGDQFDKGCTAPLDKLTKFERFDFMLKQPLVHRLTGHLEKHGFAEQVIQQVRKIIHAIEKVRPPSQGIEFLDRSFRDLGHTANDPQKGKPTLNVLLKQDKRYVISHAYDDKIQNVFKQHLFKGLSRGMSTKVGEKFLNQYIGYKHQKVRANAFQFPRIEQVIKYMAAQGLPVNLFYWGHIHRIVDEALGNCRLYNGAGFKPVIHLKEEGPSEEFYPAGGLRIEYNRENRHIESELLTSVKRLSRVA